MNVTGPELLPLLVNEHRQKQRAGQHSVAPEYLAAQIKAARESQNFTLKTLSETSKIPLSTLSKIENNRISPTFQMLQQLAQALQLDLPQLFAKPSGEARLSRRVLTRRTEGINHRTPCYEHRLLANELTQKKMLPFTCSIRARSLNDCRGWVRHRGEEFFMVLRGAVALHCEFYEPVYLEAGDSSYFDSTMGHALISISEEDAEVVWVVALN